jgi:hypothetical protein
MLRPFDCIAILLLGVTPAGTAYATECEQHNAAEFKLSLDPAAWRTVKTVPRRRRQFGRG